MDSGGQDGIVWSEVMSDALDLLADALHWRLAEARWNQVDAIVQTLEEALAAEDVAQIHAATVELELIGPTRILRIGTVSRLPPPSQVRERIGRAEQRLREMSVDGRRGPDGGATGKESGGGPVANQR